METVVSSPVDDPAELHLLTHWEQDRGRVRQAGALSALAHVVAIVLLCLIPKSMLMPPQRSTETQITPLIEPPTELTQTAPNKGRVAKEVTVEGLRPRPHIQIPTSPPSTTRPAARIEMPRAVPAAPPVALPAPPQIATNQGEVQTPRGLPLGPPAEQPAPPQIQAQENSPFEAPTAPPPTRGVGQIQRPDTSVAGAIREVTRGGPGGGLTVGDDMSDTGIGGLGSGLNLPPSPGRAASQLELLSNPMGVDFRPYLIQVLSAVRRNWFAVYPESARMGLRGRVETQFMINRDGSVPKLVIVEHSAPALDRAAVAGIDASHPFPPFPTGFLGDHIVLKLVFSYNMPRR